MILWNMKRLNLIINNNMKIILFLFFLFSNAFLLFSEGYWLYLDTSFYPINEYKIIDYFYMWFFWWNFDFWSIFWADSMSFYSTRLLNYIIYFLPLEYIQIFFLTINYILVYVLLKRNNIIVNNIMYIIVFILFNPISIYFFQESWFIFAYSSIFFILLWIHWYFKEKKYLYLFLSWIWFYFLLSYTRITWLYWLFLILIWFYYFSFIKDIFLNKKKELIIFIIFHLLIFTPFLFAFIFPYFNWDKEYFSWLWNYASSHIQVWEWLYNLIQNSWFWNAFVIKEITWNFAWEFQKTLFFEIYSVIFILGIFIYSLFINSRIKDKLVYYLSWIFLFIIFINISPKFIDKEIFIDIAYKYFPFIANNTNWLFVLYIPILAYLLSFSLENTKKIFIRNILIFSTIFYSFLSIYPLIDYKDNPKLQTIDIKKDLPINYQNTFYKESIEKNPSLFFPWAWLYFEWSPYPFEIWNNTLYQTLFTNNSRIVNQKQADLNNIVNDLKEKNNIQNNSLFNLKNIFVFKDIRNAEPWQFDFYSTKDYVWESKIYYDKFKNNPNLYTKQDNENFAQFWLKDDDKYQYKIYSPANIIKSEIDTFFDNTIDINKKPVVIDSKSFHKPEIIENFQIPETNKNIQITLKEALLNPTKYYIKLSNLDTSKPFLLQMNQTFGMSWKIKWVDKKYFDEKPCIDEYKNYPITQNSVCQYKTKLLELEDIRLLNKPEVNNKNHFEWNFVWNTWLLNPEDIPNEMKWQKDLYAVIIYEKQIYYSYALIISWLTFFTLIILTLIQETRLFLKRKKDKIKTI